MTVGELIKLLQAYPKNMLVIDEYGILEEEDIVVKTEKIYQEHGFEIMDVLYID